MMDGCESGEGSSPMSPSGKRSDRLRWLPWLSLAGKDEYATPCAFQRSLSLRFVVGSLNRTRRHLADSESLVVKPDVLLEALVIQGVVL
jgi:hypothetical protein